MTEDTRELDRLRSQNAQLRVDAQRYRKLSRSLQRTPAAKKAAVVAPPFELVDPRRHPQVGTKVLAPPTPPIMLGKQMGAAVVKELREMTIETRALIRRLAEGPEDQLNQAMDAPRGENWVFSDSIVRKLEALQARWKQRFANMADEWSRRMIAGIEAQSTAQLNLGLKDMAERMQIHATMATPRLRAVVEASTKACTALIERIPEQYLSEVRIQVLSAVTTGSGLDKLVPYLTERYEGDARRARLVALDQIRKATTGVNAARLLALGVKSFVWIHVGGEKYPRRLHQSYNGREFRYDDPPVIDERTEETGLPGAAINCRCIARPVVRFTEIE